MRDISFVLATIVFFGVAILYLRGCERLRHSVSESERDAVAKLGKVLFPNVPNLH